MCAASGFFSPLTVLFAGIALPLGLVCRGDERLRRLGNAAVVLSAVALLLAAVTFLMVVDVL
ncbi:hypothetical protein GCM10025786_15560 [Nocardioides caeni]